MQSSRFTWIYVSNTSTNKLWAPMPLASIAYPTPLWQLLPMPSLLRPLLVHITCPGIISFRSLNTTIFYVYIFTSNICSQLLRWCNLPSVQAWPTLTRTSSYEVFAKCYFFLDQQQNDLSTRKPSLKYSAQLLTVQQSWWNIQALSLIMELLLPLCLQLCSIQYLRK